MIIKLTSVKPVEKLKDVVELLDRLKRACEREEEFDFVTWGKGVDVLESRHGVVMIFNYAVECRMLVKKPRPFVRGE